jgi:hypothetical protein
MADDKIYLDYDDDDSSGAAGQYQYRTTQIAPVFDNEDGDEGVGGKSGQIEFRSSVFKTALRDDLLPADELRRLLIIHKDIHKEKVIKQKQTRAERAALKEGKQLNNQQTTNNKGLRSGGSSSTHLTHPLLGTKPQFDGIDKQVVGVPALNEADTNPELKAELENRLENKYRNTPKFNPTPRFPG